MGAMRAGPGLRRLRAERRLFEVNARLAVAREEAEVVAAQHAEAQAAAEGARLRMLAAETALAHRDWEEARGSATAVAASLVAARALVAELEAAQDGLLDDLLA